MTIARRSLWAFAIAVALGSCASAPPTSPAATAAALDRVLAGDQRSEEHRARDVYRHPKETLLFFGIRPEMTVVEIWPEGGWYTEVIAPLVNERGKYYAAQLPPNPGNTFVTQALEQYAQKLAARPDLYGGAVMTALGPDRLEIAPPASADLIVTFRNLHNWMAQDFAPTALAAMFRALRPGGVLGVVDHRAGGTGGTGGAAEQDPKALNGYVHEEFAIQLIESAGFKLVARSEINANPRDTKDYAQGVWTLPPTYRLGATDRAQYAAIGESDRFTLKFVKPGS